MQPLIEYAQPLPWYRRRRPQTVMVGLSVVAAIMCTCPSLFRLTPQLRFLYQQQRQWMQYTAPANTTVIAQGAAAIPLLNMPGWFTFNGPGGNSPFACRYPPNSLPVLPKFDSQSTVVFIHRLRAARSPERLVSIVPDNPWPRAGYALLAQAFRPATLEIGSRPEWWQATGAAGSYYFPAKQSLRVFAGQPDPSDESHFTICYEADGKSDTLDGWLMPDDTVKFRTR